MISKTDALDIAKKLYGSRDTHEYQVSEYDEIRFVAYNIRNPKDLWCVTVMDDEEAHIIKSSTIVLVHKETGDVVYHGSGNDDG